MTFDQLLRMFADGEDLRLLERYNLPFPVRLWLTEWKK